MSKSYMSIEKVHDTIWVCQHGVYERSSVLAGQDYRQLVKPFDTVEEAKAEFPEAKVDLEGYDPLPFELSSVAPDWFDEANAGERWNDDY